MRGPHNIFRLIQTGATLERTGAMDVELQPGSTPVLVGRPTADLRPLELSLPQRGGRGRTCWSSPGR